jgi:hypothetical protein
VRLRRIERRLAERSEAAVRTDDHRAP